MQITSCIKHNTSESNTIATKSEILINPMDQSILDSIAFSTDKIDLLFIVDASCSMCIGHFLEELSMIKETNLHKESLIGNKYVIIPEGTTPLTKWYVSKESSFSISDFFFIELPIKRYQLVNEFNGYFFTFENGIMTESWSPVYK